MKEKNNNTGADFGTESGVEKDEKCFTMDSAKKTDAGVGANNGTPTPSNNGIIYIQGIPICQMYSGVNYYEGPQIGKDNLWSVVTEMFCKWWIEQHGGRLALDDSNNLVFVNGLMRAIMESNYAVGLHEGKIGKPMYTFGIPESINETMAAIILTHTGKVQALSDYDGQNYLCVYQDDASKPFCHSWRAMTDFKQDISTRSAERVTADKLLALLNPELNTNKVYDKLFTKVNHRAYNRDKNYIPFRNGVFKYTDSYSGELIPWDQIEIDPRYKDLTFKCVPDLELRSINQDWVFTPIIEPDGKLWTPIRFFNDLFPLPEGTQLDEQKELTEPHSDEVRAVLEHLRMCIQPWRKWEKGIIYLDGTGGKKGNNGKSTVVQVMIDLNGGIQGGVVASKPIKAFGDKFGLENLLNASLVVSHENDPQQAANGLAMYKCCVTQDLVEMNRKFKTTINYLPELLTVQCFNRVGSLGDFSESFDRRLIVLIFNACFTDKNKGYIKNDYWKRKEVLEWLCWYLVFKVGRMDDGTTSYPFYKASIARFKSEFEPVASFVNETFLNNYIKNDVVSQADCLSYFKAWYKATYNTESKLKNQTFYDRLEASFYNGCGWEFHHSKTVKIKQTDKMDEFEPILYDYKIIDCMSGKFQNEYEFDRRAEDIKREACKPKYTAGCSVKGAVVRVK